MIQKHEISALMDVVADVVKRYVGETVEKERAAFAIERKALETSVSELNVKLSALPGALAQELADLTHRIGTLESRELPKGLTLEDVAPLVTQAFEAYPKPEDGKDADPPSIDDIQPIVDLAVKEAMAALPPPKDGTSVTLGDIWPHVSTHLDKAVESLFSPLTEKVVALETRTTQEQVVELVQAGLTCSPFLAELEKVELGHEALITNVDERFKSFVEPFNDRITALEKRPPEVTRQSLDDLEETVERRLAMLPLPITEEIHGLRQGLTERITALETRTNVDHINLDNVHERVMALEARPPPEKGKDADPVDVEAIAQDVLSRIPVPKDGTSVTVDDIAVILMDEHEKWAKTFEAEALTAIEKMVDEIPRPEDGKSVTIEDVQHFLEASYAKWALEAERRVIDLAQKAIDRMPAPKDGVNGIGFDDLTISRDGRKIRHDYTRNGEVVKSFEFKTDELRYQDVYRAGESYDIGDVVSWSGSIWIAVADTKTKPGGGNPDWKLSVKEGRKGKSAYDCARDNGFVGTEAEWLASLKGPKGDEGIKGKDLTQLGPDGRKW